MLKDTIFISSVKRSLKLLPKEFHGRAFRLLLLTILNSVFDLLGLAAILPLLASILKEGFIENNKILSALYQWAPVTTREGFIVLLCLGIMLIILAKNLFNIWVHREHNRFSWDTYEVISTKMLRSAYNKGYLFFTSRNSNKIQNQISRIPQVFGGNISGQLFTFINELCILCIVTTTLIIYDVRVILILSITVLPTFLLFHKLTKNKIRTIGEDLQERIPEIMKPVSNLSFGFVDVAIGGVFNHLSNRFSDNIKESQRDRIILNVLKFIPVKLVEMTVLMSVIIMLIYGIYFLENSSEIITLLSVFALAAFRTVPSINRVILSLSVLNENQNVLDTIEKYLEKYSPDLEATPMKFNQSISIDNISFRYPKQHKDVIKDYSLEIKKGETLGIIGKSGSGKTTLMNIMLGFLEPSEGEIRIDNTLLSKDTVPDFHKITGYVRQDVFLVDGNVIDNVAFGIPKDEVDINKVKEVVTKAQLDDLVENLSEGIESNIGERGAKISGGQRQRVGIARALYHNAEILFFDEATSALDSQTEEEITEAIRSLTEQNLTMIIIAHRENTLKYCDRIISL